MNLLNYVKNIEHSNSYPLGNLLKRLYEKKNQKDKKIRKLFNQQEIKYVILKSIIKNENLSLIVK